MTTQIIDRVIQGDYCIGCGLCAAMAPEDFDLSFTPEGMFRSTPLRPAAERGQDLSTLCPMSGTGPDETRIAARLWPDLPDHPEVGRHGISAVGWVNEGDFRARGASGGLLTWLAVELLARGLVEEVVQVAPAAGTGTGTGQIFSYSVSRSAEDVLRAAKSRYYPVHARDMIAHLRTSGRATLFVGIPCFVKMIRLLAEEDPAVARTVRFTLGLVCGHLKSQGFAELLAWQVGVPPGQIGMVDFRVKKPGHPASSYGFMAQGPAPSQEHHEVMMADLLGRDWGQGMMKYKACDYCDDVLAECADIAVGDAWLDPWKQEWQGTNVFVARHPVMVEILREAADQRRITIEDIGPDRVADSQRAGLRHRREGLAWRLWRDRRRGLWVPRKRVAPSAAIARQRRRIYDARDRIRDDSHRALLAAKAAGRLEVFAREMQPALRRYARAMRQQGPVQFLRRKARNLMGRLQRRLGG